MPEPTYQASDRVIFTPLVDGTGVLLELDTKFYFTLNAAGVVVWQRLNSGGASAAELTDELVGRFEVDEPTAAADVAALLADLTTEALVRVGG